MKNTLVATYGYKLVGSVLSARTLNVQQLPSIFSTLKTFEHVVLISDPAQLTVESLVIGMLHGTPFGEIHLCITRTEYYEK